MGNEEGGGRKQASKRAAAHAGTGGHCAKIAPLSLSLFSPELKTELIHCMSVISCFVRMMAACLLTEQTAQSMSQSAGNHTHALQWQTAQV